MLDRLFEAERTARAMHDELLQRPPKELLDGLRVALEQALAEPDEAEASLRLVRIAALLGELEGPRAVDALIDVLASEHPEARRAAGEEIEELAFERFKEVAGGVERALERLPTGSPALLELPFILVEVPEPGVTKLLARFLQHPDPDAVAAAIEAFVELGDPSAARLIEPLTKDQRTVEVGDEGEEAADVTIGELAEEALELLEGLEEDEAPRPGGNRRGKPS